jgi:CRP/FNR family transcriptional regulator, cyclic AMP receptor protein
MAESLVDALRKIQFLRDVDDEFLARLAPLARTVLVPAGAVLFRQGDPAKSFYLLLEGSASLEFCAPAVGCKRILTIEAGELLGWSPVLGQSRMTATARVIADAVAVELNSAGCLALCESEPRFGYELMKRTALALAKRLNATRLQLVNVYGDDMPPVAQEQIGRQRPVD